MLHRAARSVVIAAWLCGCAAGGWARPCEPPAEPRGAAGTTVVTVDAAEVRREIEGVLAAMVAEVKTGDGAAYLSHVARPADVTTGNDDPGLAAARFRKEQENWAQELAKSKPVEFDLAIDDDEERPGEFAAARAVFRMRMTYRMEEGSAKNRTSAAWPAVFVKGPAGWLYAGEDWKTMEGDGFVIKYFPKWEKVARDVLAAFPKAKAHDDRQFGIANTTPQTIKLYADMEHLKATVFLNMPDPILGGWNEPGESIKFMVNYTRGEAGWAGAFAHEYGHVATWELGAKANDMPWWIEEGVAEYAAADLVKGYRERTNATIRGLAAKGKLARWEAISDYMTAAQSVKQLAYLQGYHMIAFITETYGTEDRNQWLRRMGKGESLDEATKAVFDISFEQLDGRWRSQFDASTDNTQKEGGKE